MEKKYIVTKSQLRRIVKKSNGSTLNGTLIISKTGDKLAINFKSGYRVVKLCDIDENSEINQKLQAMALKLPVT